MRRVRFVPAASDAELLIHMSFCPDKPILAELLGQALVGFQGREFVDGVHSVFCPSLLLEGLIFQ
jgi:hypothetical protein